MRKANPIIRIVAPIEPLIPLMLCAALRAASWSSAESAARISERRWASEVGKSSRILAEPERDWVPRTVIFSGKSASAYFMAKLIIKLIIKFKR